MAEPQTDGIMKMMDPLGFWKTSREATLEAWSKMMIDAVNSDEYARSTGQLLDQYLTVSQPVQDMVQKAMTNALAYVNMPTRDEVLSLAERLINIETRLDDLDAKTSEMREDDHKEFRAIERRIDKVEGAITASNEGVTKEIRAVERRIEKVEGGITASKEAATKEVNGLNRSLEKALTTIMARLDKLEAAITPRPEPKAEVKPEPKAEAKPEAKAEARK